MRSAPSGLLTAAAVATLTFTREVHSVAEFDDLLQSGKVLFGVPILGSLFALALLSTLFITTNLAIGYTFSTIVQNQLQAMQLSMMF